MRDEGPLRSGPLGGRAGDSLDLADDPHAACRNGKRGFTGHRVYDASVWGWRAVPQVAVSGATVDRNKSAVTAQL